MDQHVKILGILHVVLGSLGVVAAFVMVVIFAGLDGIYGVAGHPNDSGVGVFTVPSIGGLIGGGLAAIVVLLSLPALIGGIALLMRASWSRIFMIVISALHLLHVPFGTLLGIYGLWVLTRPEAPAYFAARRY